MTALIQLQPQAGEQSSRPRETRIALLGTPNSGKTTLFNALTGHRAKTGNYPGVTVDRREGWLWSGASAPGDHSSPAIRLIDLPGIYSLHPQSEDESVAVGVLTGSLDEMAPDGVLVVLDATSLDRSLPLLAEVAALGLPTGLVLTMVDELKARGGDIDITLLQRQLNLPVFGVVGTRGVGIGDLSNALTRSQTWPRQERQAGQPDGVPPEERFRWAHAILDRSRRQRPAASAWTARLDGLLLHPILGPVLFFAFVVFFFQAIFSWAGPAMDTLAGLTDSVANWLLVTLPDTLPTRLLADGVVRGVGAVVVFLPQIMLLFTVILFLEGCGYMARAAFVIDRVMGWAGLEGRCFLALLSSYACAVPGVMATRTIPSPRDRLATILVAPFATCSARLPVYALLIATFIPAQHVVGPFTWQGLTLTGLYLLGTVTAVFFAAVFKRGMLRGAALPFYLELPPYRLPLLKDVALGVWDRARMFLRRAGTIILSVSIVLWFLLNLPRREFDPQLSPAQNQQQILEGSLAAAAGKALEPVFAPMDFDWRINVGLVASQAAREVMVSTMAQIYAHEDSEGAGLGPVLRAEDPQTGRPRLSFASAMALLVYFAFAMQCMSTMAVIRRETGTWRWPLFVFAYMTGLGWLAAWCAYHLAS